MFASSTCARRSDISVHGVSTFLSTPQNGWESCQVDKLLPNRDLVGQAATGMHQHDIYHRGRCAPCRCSIFDTFLAFGSFGGIVARAVTQTFERAA